MGSFDARAAKQLPAGSHLTLDEAPGLRLEATAAGRSWIYRYKSPLTGLMKQCKLGAWPAVSLGEAMGDWAALKQQRDAGRCPATERKEDRRRAKTIDRAVKHEQRVEALTVRCLCDRFGAEYAVGRRKPKGVRELQRLFATMLPAELASAPAVSITRGTAYGLINSHAATPVVAASLRRELGAAWDWAIDSGELPEDTPNWWRLVLRGKLQSKGRTIRGKQVGIQKVVLLPDQVGALLRFLPHVSRLPAEIITLYLWTGCRGSEICSMMAEEVVEEVDGWWWTIPKAKTKTARHPDAVDLRVPLSGRALEIVRARLDVYPTGYLFPAVNKNSREPHVQQKVVGVAVWWHRPECEERPEWPRQRWPVPHFTPHDLRRTVRTQLARLGCPDNIAEAVIGHLPGGVGGIYNRHTYDAERLLWLGKLRDSWESAAAR